tara:strand:+ start:204 stop:596 length:393 start_codon:yes stop_codon:yes gene_type:complete
MKRLLFAPLLLTLLVASCSTKKKYNSYREANDACKEWADKGGYYIQKFSAQKAKKWDFDEELTFFPAQEYKHSLRFCKEEKETKQVLGIQTTNRKNGDIGFPEGDVPCKWPPCNFRWGNDETRVDKNFYY